MVVVAVTLPAEELIALPANTDGLGKPKFAWFSRLKTSARNCMLIFSDTAVFLNTEKSTSVIPGPVSTPLPTFPKVPTIGRM